MKLRKYLQPVFLAVLLMASIGSSIANANGRHHQPPHGYSCRDPQLQQWCSMGDQTPNSVRDDCARCGLGGWGQGGNGGHNGYSCRDPQLQQWCSMGDQTPNSVRDDCARCGLGGWGNGGHYGYSCRDPQLQQWCSMGDQTPNSVRDDCHRCRLGGW